MAFRPFTTLVLGGILLLSSQVLNLFGLFRSVDWLRLNAPSVFAFLNKPGVETTLVIAGLGTCLWGLFETLKIRKTAKMAKLTPQELQQAVRDLEQHYRHERNLTGALSDEQQSDFGRFVQGRLRAMGLDTEVTAADHAEQARPRPLSNPGPITPPFGPPTAIRVRNSRDIAISGNDFEIDSGAEGV